MLKDFNENVDRRNTNCFKWDKLHEKYGKEDIISMWIADMEFKAPEKVIASIVERAKHGIYGYTFRDDKYYDTISEWMKKRHDWNIENDWIVFSPGIVPALSFCVSCFTNVGDGIIVPSPAYPPFFNAVKDQGRIVVESCLKYEGTRYHIDFNGLNRSVKLMNLEMEKNETEKKVKMIFLCNPHNPIGRVWRKDELCRIGEFCLENDILIVSDDIHSDIVYEENQYTPIASLCKEFEDITITCISPGKTFSMTGLATSSIIIPNIELRKTFAKMVESYELDGGNVFGMVASTAAYEHGEEWLIQLLNYLETNRNYMLDYFETNIKEIKPIKPEGTYLVWLDCSGLGLSGTELMDFFVSKAGIAVNPGISFSEHSDQFVRMNIGCTFEQLESALSNLEYSVRNL